MPTFNIPQFIEEKPKIVGPLTIRQFLTLVFASIVSLMAYYTVGIFLWLLITIIVGGIGLSIAFVKIGGRSLPTIIFIGVIYLIRPHRYIWKNTPSKITLDTSPLEHIIKERRRASTRRSLKSIVNSLSFKNLRRPSHIRGAQKQKEVLRSITGETETAERIDYSS